MRVRVTPEDSPAANYAFDVTPARLVTALITERGVCKPSLEGLRRLYPGGTVGKLPPRIVTYPLTSSFPQGCEGWGPAFHPSLRSDARLNDRIQASVGSRKMDLSKTGKICPC